MTSLSIPARLFTRNPHIDKMEKILRHHRLWQGDILDLNAKAKGAS
jgi:hypothetical protein